MTTEQSCDRSAYLADVGEGPAPIFRADRPEAFEWPEGATFAIVFRKMDFRTFPWNSHYGSKESFVAFYGSDGWPIGFLVELRGQLSDIMKKQFQIFPSDWRRWGEWDWRSAKEHPELFARMRAQATLGRCFMPFLPDPELPEN